jgi:hypothetical protein
MPITVGHEHRGYPVSQPLRATLAGLRGCYLSGDLGQGGALPHRGGTHRQYTGGIHAGAYDEVADGLIDRHGYAGQHGFIHRTGPADDFTVGGDFLPGSDPQHISDDDVIDRDEHVDAPPNHPSLLGAEFEHRA